MKDYTFKVLPLGLAMLIYTVFASFKLSTIPLGYDEALFCNAALGIDPDLFLFVKCKGFPILLMDYIGALKAWIYMPIFKLFGVSVWTIRFPMVMLTLVSLWLIHKILTELWNPYIAAFTVLYLSLDVSFLYYTKIDTGPNAIELLLKLCIIYQFLQFIKTNNFKNLAWIITFSLLGLFNKLNFIWFINAFYAGVCIGYGKTIWKLFWSYNAIKKTQFLLLTGGTYLVSVIYLLTLHHYFDIFGQKIGAEHGLLQPFQRLHSLLIDVVGGSGIFIYSYRYGFSEWPNWLTYSQTILAYSFIGFTVVASLLILIKKEIAQNRFFFFSLAILLALLAQIFVTERARYGWHIFMIYPFFTYVGIYAIYFCFEKLTPSIVLRKSFTLLAFTLMTGQLIAAQYKHIAAMRRQPFKNNSPTIYQFVDFAKQSNKKFVLINASATTQLVTLTQQKDKYFELSYLFEVSHKFLTLHAKTIEEFNQKFFQHPDDYLFVTTKVYDYPAKGQVVRFKDFTCYNFFDVLETYHCKAIKVKDIALDEQGYSIYRIVPKDK